MSRPKKSTIKFLRDAYEQGGFVRIKMDHRRDGVRSGWELRLPSRDGASPARLMKLLRSVGFLPGKPYFKRERKIIPIYGRENVQRFLHLICPKVKARLPRPPADTDLRLRRKQPRQRSG
jgi:hypothetical protein